VAKELEGKMDVYNYTTPCAVKEGWWRVLAPPPGGAAPVHLRCPAANGADAFARLLAALPRSGPPRRSPGTRPSRAPTRGASSGPFDRLQAMPRHKHLEALHKIQAELHDRTRGPSRQEFRQLIVEYGKVYGKVPRGWAGATRVLRAMPEGVSGTPHYKTRASRLVGGRRSPSKRCSCTRTCR
jgi:hypothetical protein